MDDDDNDDTDTDTVIVDVVIVLVILVVAGIGSNLASFFLYWIESIKMKWNELNVRYTQISIMYHLCFSSSPFFLFSSFVMK